MIKTARRMETFVPHFFASLNSRIAAMRAAGLDVVRLDEGSPDLPPAPHIIEALVRSARLPDHHAYQPHAVNPAYRKAWATMYQSAYGVEIDPEREVVPLLGSKEGIFHTIQAFVEPGDIVLIPDPGYVTYTRGTVFSGGEPYYFPLLPERGYLPDLSAIPADIARHAKMMWLNFPNNPTAAIAPLEFFKDAAAFAAQYDILLCHDAAYSQVTFNGVNAPSLLKVRPLIPPARLIEFNTLSKSHNMAGWRVGAILGDAEVLRPLFTLKTNLDSSHFLPILEAATVAMTSDQSWLKERNAVYCQRRDVLVQGLHAIGLPVEVPQGSLYVWSPVPQGMSAMDFVTLALEKAQVSFTPGSVFGKNREEYIRISITAPVERIALAMERLSHL